MAPTIRPFLLGISDVPPYAVALFLVRHSSVAGGATVSLEILRRRLGPVDNHSDGLGSEGRYAPIGRVAQFLSSEAKVSVGAGC